MCALCGVLLDSTGPSRTAAGAARVFRVQLVEQGARSLRAAAERLGRTVYVLRDRKGASAVVDDLASLWVEAERLAGRPLDPLDPALVAALGR